MVEGNFLYQKYCVREWLKELREDLATIQSTLLKYQELKASIDYSNTAYKTTQNQSQSIDSIANKVIAMLDLEKLLTSDYKDLYNAYTKAYIHMHSKEETYILWLRYVDYKSWNDIAITIGYSRSKAYRLSLEGYRTAYKLIPEGYIRALIPNAVPI